MIKLFILLFLFISCKTNKISEPLWFSDISRVFPHNEYIAQKGSGKTNMEAKTSALQALSFYFNAQIDTTLQTSYFGYQDKEFTGEKIKVKEDTVIKSNSELFGVEYTESYFSKTDRKYYCCAYLNRKTAYKNYSQILNDSQKIFLQFVEATKKNEPIDALRAYKNALGKGDDFLHKLEYARILSPEDIHIFNDSVKIYNSLPLKIQKIKDSITFKISVTDDYNEIITKTIIDTLKQKDFSVSKNGNYFINVKIFFNIQGSDPYEISPSATLVVESQQSQSKNALIQIQEISDDKSISYYLEKAKEKSFPMLAKKLAIALSNELDNVMHK